MVRINFKKTVFLILMLCFSRSIVFGQNYDIKLYSLKPQEILSKYDLNDPKLSFVKFAYDQGKQSDALKELRSYYRQKYPLPGNSAKDSYYDLTTADRIVEHIFQWGPYEPADYGEDMDWQWDPRGDIEWVAAIYRFYWAPPLADAYRITGDEKYAKAFVELTSDWIAKHPLENRNITHSVYTSWRGYPWLDIQTGIRADPTCAAFSGRLFMRSLLLLNFSVYFWRVYTIIR